jgi:sugar-phosphatase
VLGTDDGTSRYQYWMQVRAASADGIEGPATFLARCQPDFIGRPDRSVTEVCLTGYPDLVGAGVDRVGAMSVPFPLSDRSFEAVLFDLDGTLVDSTPAVIASWLRWADQFGVDPQVLAGRHGIPARSIVLSLAAEGLLSAPVEVAEARINELEVAAHEGIVALPGAVEALAALPGGRAAIVTSCVAALAAVRIDAARLSAPTVLVTVDRVRKGKPDPEPFLLAATELGVDPHRCLVVEDAPSGLAAAKAAGCATLAVVTTTLRTELQADAVVDTLADVVFTVDVAGVHVNLR